MKKRKENQKNLILKMNIGSMFKKNLDNFFITFGSSSVKSGPLENPWLRNLIFTKRKRMNRKKQKEKNEQKERNEQNNEKS